MIVILSYPVLYNIICYKLIIYRDNTVERGKTQKETLNSKFSDKMNRDNVADYIKRIKK